MEDKRKKHVLIVGAGPAGLTSAYLLAKQNIAVTVIEADDCYVGGISRTVAYKGYLFDIGGHRFFSKSQEVEDFWTEILPNDMLIRPRSSRIYYKGKFFSYPLKPLEALLKLGFIESLRTAMSYIYRCVKPIRNPKNFEEWVSNQFGTRLFQIFFKTYTEKVWGMDCKDISSDWAAQRIKGLSLWSALKHALRASPKSREKSIKTLINSFRYPRRGPGMMWETCSQKIKQMSGQVFMGHRVQALTFDRATCLWKLSCVSKIGEEVTFIGTDVISTAPMRELVASITPKASASAMTAAKSLQYRDFITVALIIREQDAFLDNWIYIHDPKVKVGRIQNFKSWSPEMVPHPATNCYGLEYFCFENDQLWSASNEELIDLAKRELVAIGLASLEDILDGCVIRQAKAYPVYDEDYAKNVDVIRKELEANFPTLHLIGRNGMHKYNNQDHSMMTAMLCVKNILAQKNEFDLWKVNQDAEYHESTSAKDQRTSSTSGLRAVPKKVVGL